MIKIVLLGAFVDRIFRVILDYSNRPNQGQGLWLYKPPSQLFLAQKLVLVALTRNPYRIEDFATSLFSRKLFLTNHKFFTIFARRSVDGINTVDKEGDHK